MHTDTSLEIAPHDRNHTRQVYIVIDITLDALLVDTRHTAVAQW